MRNKSQTIKTPKKLTIHMLWVFFSPSTNPNESMSRPFRFLKIFTFIQHRISFLTQNSIVCFLFHRRDGPPPDDRFRDRPFDSQPSRTSSNPGGSFGASGSSFGGGGVSSQSNVGGGGGGGGGGSFGSSSGGGGGNFDRAGVAAGGGAAMDAQQFKRRRIDEESPRRPVLAQQQQQQQQPRDDYRSSSAGLECSQNLRFFVDFFVEIFLWLSLFYCKTKRFQ